jgi:hypothetical protein
LEGDSTGRHQRGVALTPVSRPAMEVRQP